MRAPMMIAVAQPVTSLHDVSANADAHARAVRNARARVVVFPELSLTGYATAVPMIAPDDPRLAPIVSACRHSDSIALVGAPMVARSGVTDPTIGILLVTGEGVRPAYRKMFLGTAEEPSFVPGCTPTVLVVDGWRLGLAICKDTGVAEHARRTASAGIDAYVAGVCESETDRLVQPARARRVATDHDVWVAVASFAGPTGGGFDVTAGRSFVMRPDGCVAAEASREPGQVVTTSMVPR